MSANVKSVADQDKAKARNWLAAIIVGALAGAACWYIVVSERAKRSLLEPQRSGAESDSGVAFADDSIAMRYAAAVQDGNCDEIIRLTLWMRDRLNYVRFETGGDQASVDEARTELCDDVQTRRVEGNRIALAGIDDQYIFVPGAAIEAVSAGPGRSDLAKPVNKALRVRVTYPLASRAPKSESGASIRSLEASIYVSSDGYVLKAGVVGNLDIDWDSFAFDWPSERGD